MVETYDKKSLIRYLLILLGVVFLMKGTYGIGFVVVVPLILTACARRNHEDLLFYLVMSGTLVVGNSYFVPKTVFFFILQRFILMVLAAFLGMQVFGRRMNPLLKPFMWLVLYLLFMLMTASFGWCPMVSYLKLALFLLCFFAYFGVATRIVEGGRLRVERVRSILLCFACFYIFGSMLLIPYPEISQLSGEDYAQAVAAGKELVSLFTGMTNQSQCLGPVVAGLACLLLGDMLFGLKRWDKLYVMLLLCAPYLVYKTSSRTAAGSLLVAILSVVYYFVKTRGIASRWKSRVVSMSLVLGIFASVTLLTSAGFRQGIIKFVLKFGDDVKASDVTMEAVASSRQGLMDRAMYNFRRSPLFGNGFQVMEHTEVKTFKQALSAPIEKGVWVTAVLEEGGVVGFSLFCSFILVAVCSLPKHGGQLGCCTLITFIASNMGEFTFFSMSYTGGFLWAMVFLGLVLDMGRKYKRPPVYCN